MDEPHDAAEWYWYPAPASEPGRGPAAQQQPFSPGSAVPSPRRRRTKAYVAIAAVIAAVTTVIVVATGSDDASRSFCRDYEALGSVSTNGLLGSAAAAANSVPDQLRALADDAPTPATAADLRLLADHLDAELDSGTPTVSSIDGSDETLADRIDAAAERACGGDAG